MAIKQTVVFTKAGGTLLSLEDALLNISLATSDPAQKNELLERLNNGEFSNNAWFDQANQSLTIQRIWSDEANFNSYKANWPGEGPNKVAVEQAGWICSPETTEVI